MTMPRPTTFFGLPRETLGPFVAGVVMTGSIWAGLAAPAAAQVEKLTAAEKAAICAEAEPRLKDFLAAHPIGADVTPVAIFKEVFCPPDLTVKAGSKVLFVNVEKRTSHSVWFKADGKAESDRFFPDETLEQALDLPPGEHVYTCGPHPWMKGTIQVEGRTP
ncbi:MAG: plastocyanin/azurin family copper-binding protein [Hyphomicrobiales bacterium]|nr:plastocyanin/azurin family copper-binding protein [Hyphomicrobiales bacterium]